MSSGRPSEVLSRMSDALFTFLDQNVEIPQLRGTGYIEPLKYGWLHRRLAIDPVSVRLFLLVVPCIPYGFFQCRILEENIQTYYNMSSIPYHVVVINGIPTPILDRRGFLHMIVFDIRATPDDSHLVRAARPPLVLECNTLLRRIGPSIFPCSVSSTRQRTFHSRPLSLARLCPS
jgi:hypothetical protein